MKVYNTNRKVLKRFTIIEVIVSCIVVLTTLVGHNGIHHSKLMTFAVYKTTLHILIGELLIQTIIWLGFTLYYLITKIYKELLLSIGIWIVLSFIGIVCLKVIYKML